MDKFTKSEDFRRDELIRIIEHSVEHLTLQELEALYYDMTTKNFINDWGVTPNVYSEAKSFENADNLANQLLLLFIYNLQKDILLIRKIHIWH